MAASNPYDSPENACGPSDKGRKWSFVNFVVLGMSLAGTAHFVVSLLAWGWLLYCFTGRYTEQPEWSALWYALPTVLLLPLFALTADRAWRRAKGARILLLAAISLSVAAFVFDAVNRNWQLHVEWKTPDSPPPFFYCNWWWYDERWAPGATGGGSE